MERLGGYGEVVGVNADGIAQAYPAIAGILNVRAPSSD